MSVYKPCDIRGPVSELSTDLYRRWGQVLAAPLPRGSKVVVGGDVRLSTPAFQAAFTAGIRQHEVEAVDLGTVPTPLVYFAQRRLGARLAAVVTASHSPPDVNGLKWVVDGRPPTPADVQDLRARAEAPGSHLASGNGRARGGCAAHPVVAGAAAPPAPASAGRATADLEAEYAAWLRGLWYRPDAALAICVDPGSGCWAGRAAPLLRQAFPGCRVQAIHDVPDGHFAARSPDSSRPEHLRALARMVRDAEADIGLAFDGDGDRVSVLDECGRMLSAEETAWLLIASFGDGWPGRVFVHDVKLSPRVAAAAAARGGSALAQRSGHAFIRTTMIDQNALFGAEISGHYFYAELDGRDDAMYTACRLVAECAGRGMPLSQLRARCPRIHTSGDLRLPANASQQQAVLERVEQAFAQRPLDRTDGIRVPLDGGWALVRPSVTAAELTFRFEGNTPEALTQVIQTFAARLGDVGAQLVRLHQHEEGGEE